MGRQHFLLLFVFMACIAPTTGCFIYHKPEFTGQILDKETKQPIEGAVVMAVYNKQDMGLGAGANTLPIDVQESLTNSEGEFRIPSYTTLIVPIFSREYATTFIIFKPGYGSLSGLALEDYFSKKKAKPLEEEINIFLYNRVSKEIKVQSSIGLNP
jgi:hypothetical protein